jgi:hypothetical protein
MCLAIVADESFTLHALRVLEYASRELIGSRMQRKDERLDGCIAPTPIIDVTGLVDLL